MTHAGPAFAELVAATNYSFLRGASPPSDMVAQAISLGMAGIGIADRNTVAGVVRAHVALRDALERAAEAGLAQLDFRLIVGARLVFEDGTPDIIAYPATRHGWGRLTRLLTLGNLRAEKGGCVLRIDDLLTQADDLLLIVMAAAGDDHVLGRLAMACPGSVWLGVTMPRAGNDRRRLARLIHMAVTKKVSVIATNDALYATPDQRPLHDVLTCIQTGTTIAAAGRRLFANAERHLKGAAEMTGLFRDCPQTLMETTALMARIDFTLDQLRYEYPHEPVPEGWDPQDWLEHMVVEAAHARYGTDLPAKVQTLLDEEFRLIRQQAYACYFLTVHDLVRFARAQEPPILCQGAGRRPTRSSVSCWASPRSIRCSMICCFPASCPKNVANRPISTLISSMNGARR